MMTRFQRAIVLPVVLVFALALGGGLSGQSLGSPLLGGGLSGGSSGLLLNGLRGSSGAGTGGLTLPQTTVPQQPGLALSTVPTEAAPQQPVVVVQPQPSPSSSIELMYGSRLPEGSAPLTQFGYEFFQRQALSPFTSVGQNYVVGPGDVLATYLWGDSVEVSGLQSLYMFQVNPDGSAFLAPVGSFPASGLSLSEIRDYLKASLSKQYKKFDIAVTLAKMREFPVYVSGFVNAPGPVMATAIDSVFNVIARASGIAKAGSLRKIAVNRAGGTSSTIDLYNMLIAGKSSDIQVREGDSIFVPQIGRVAAIAGAVMRPGIYELEGERTAGDLIRLAGGLLPSANSSEISILRFQDDQRTLIDEGGSGRKVEALPLEDGDLVSVSAVRDYVRNDVRIRGEVMYPGIYSLERAGSLRSFIELAQLLPDTDLFYGRIYRTAAGGVQENMTFSPKEVLDGKGDITLKARDQIVLYPFGQNLADVNFDNFPNTVTLEGNVRYPGMYAWKPGLKLSEIFSKANYLIDTNVQYAIVVRKEIGSEKESIETFSPLMVTNRSEDVTLQALDQVRFFPKAIARPVEVSGAVMESKVIQYYDGIDLIDVLRTVSLDASATQMKAYIYREGAQQETAGGTAADAGGPGVAPPIGGGAAQAAKTQAAPATQQAPPSAASTPPSAPQAAASSASGGEQAAPQAPFVVYLDDFLTRQSLQSVPLQPGDRIVFAMVRANEKAPQVIVRGQVQRPGAYLWKPGMHLSALLAEAGGYTSDAYPEGLVLLRKSTADLQRQQLNRAQQELQIALEKNIQDSAAGLTATQASTAQSSIQLQIQAQQAQLEALRAQIASVLGRISIRMPKTLEELKGSPQDLLLEKADVIFLPTTPTYVQIIGDVYNPVTVAYQPGLKVRDYLNLAGGPTSTAQPRDSYAILADGTIVSAHQKQWRLFAPRTIENDPVTPGETIVIAQKPTKPNETLPITAQVSSVIGSIASTALSVMAILRL